MRLNDDDNTFIGVTEDINKAIKKTARTITKTKPSEKIRSEIILQRANLKCLNEAVASIVAVTVWKAKQSMNPLGRCLFEEKLCLRSTRSEKSLDIRPPVPGYHTLATNVMAKVWNSVPGLQTASSLSAAKEIARKWARQVPR